MVADGLVEKVGPIDIALGQHVLTDQAGHVGTHAGPMLSAAASVKVVLTGKGSHGSMPHLGVDPVVLAASIVTRLQGGIVSRELSPNDFGVVTVGSLQAGTKANVIPGSATLLINVRAYDEGIKAKILASIERIVRAECQASNTPAEPTLEVYDEYPLTDNDPPDQTAKVTAAFQAHFGADRVDAMDRVTASEDFSIIPDAFGVKYAYWGLRRLHSRPDAAAQPQSRFRPPAMQPTLRTGTEAAVTAVLAYLGKDA